MKLIVDELPYYKSDCPFCASYYDENEEEWIYECTLTNLSKEECDLENLESCKGLTIESRPTGVWVGIDEEPHEEWECSYCGNIINTYMQVELEEHEYCHKCGAKMSMPWADMRGEE